MSDVQIVGDRLTSALGVGRPASSRKWRTTNDRRIPVYPACLAWDGDNRKAAKFPDMEQCQAALAAARVHTPTTADENEWVWTAVCLPADGGRK